jgi:dipeptidyl aminopeptidase/acylaminoacyl peptidase
LSRNGVRDATTLATGDVAHVFPATSPNGEDFVYVAVRNDGRRVARLHSEIGETDVRATAAHAAFPAPEWLLFMQGDTVVAESRQGEGAGARRAVPLALGVGTTSGGRGLFVASADVLLHAPRNERLYRLTWLDLRGSPVDTTADVGDYRQVRVSPDGRHLAVTATDALLGSLDVLKIAIDEASPSLRLTESIAADTDPVWSPDGRRLLFRSMSGGKPAVFMTASDIAPIANGANGPTRASTLATEADGPTDWRGEEMLLQRRSKAGLDLVRLRAEGTVLSEVGPAANSAFNETDGRWSPDGRWIAYVSDEPGRPEIYVVGRVPPPTPAADGGPGTNRQRVSFGGGTHPRWTRDSRTLLFLRGSTLMRADIAGGTRLGSPRPVVDVPGIRDFDVSPRSDRLIAIVPIQADPVDAISVILNWRSTAEALLRASRPETPPKF